MLSALVNGSMGEFVDGGADSIISTDLMIFHSRIKTISEIVALYDGGKSNGKERSLSSKIFLLLLEEYLGTSTMFRNDTSKGTTSEDESGGQRAFVGLALIAFQENVPVELLLRDGMLSTEAILSDVAEP